MTEEDYTNAVKAQLLKDKVMCKYFMSTGQKPKAEICYERSKVLQKELSDN
jgi:hypothetical protein